MLPLTLVYLGAFCDKESWIIFSNSIGTCFIILFRFFLVRIYCTLWPPCLRSLCTSVVVDLGQCDRCQAWYLAILPCNLYFFCGWRVVTGFFACTANSLSQRLRIHYHADESKWLQWIILCAPRNPAIFILQLHQTPYRDLNWSRSDILKEGTNLFTHAVCRNENLWTTSGDCENCEIHWNVRCWHWQSTLNYYINSNVQI